MMLEVSSASYAAVHEEDQQSFREVIGITMTLAGLCECAMVLTKDDIVFDLQFCEKGEIEALKAKVAADNAETMEANKHHEPRVVEAPRERLERVASNLLRSLGHTMIKA